jgi:hypothetical protein
LEKFSSYLLREWIDSLKARHEGGVPGVIRHPIAELGRPAA